MRGLLRKILLEVRVPVLLFAAGLAVVMGLLACLVPQVLGQADELLKSVPFLKPLLRALLNTDLANGFTTPMIQAFVWVHPTVLALVWAHEVMYCTRVPAAEVDRGTIDFLLGLPVSRWQLYIAETIGWLVSGVVILACGCAGYLLASQTVRPEMLPTAAQTTAVLCNLFAVYLVVGSLTLAVSANSERRGRAIGVVFAVLLSSFLLNFLAQFWAPAKQVAFLGIMGYYKPAAILGGGGFPTGHILTLLTGALVLWTIGGVVLQRRSICTV